MRSDKRDMDFESFYTAHAREMYWVGMALCRDSFMSEEAVQSVFMQLWEERMDLKSIRNPHSYLATRVRNRVLDMLRHRSVVYEHEPQLMYEIESSDLEGLSEEEREEMLAEAWRLVNSLPEACREIFLMSAMEGLKYAEIAERRGVSINTVKTQIRLAKKKLRGNQLALLGLGLLTQYFL